MPFAMGIQNLALVCFFGDFIGSSAAPWHADSENVYMSIANITASWSKTNFLPGGRLPFPFLQLRPT